MTATCIFDFDGVLFDSARECLEVAYHTAREQSERLPFARAFLHDSTPSPEIADAFVRHRYFVGPPWQYAVLLRCIVERRMPRSTDAFLERAAAEQSSLAFFSEMYFAKRTELARERAWYSLVTPYAPAAEAFRDLVARGRAAILSTRDDRSIMALCHHYFGFELSERQLLPRAAAREKWHILLEHARNLDVPLQSVFFVDDYLQHALPARQRGVSAHLATWGYLGPSDVQEARAAGLPCLALDDLSSVLRNYEESSS